MKRMILVMFTMVAVLACTPGGSDSAADAVADRSEETAADVSEDQIEWLFVQNSEGVVLEDDVLRLVGVDPVTVFFSDRPARQAGLGATSQLITYWNDGGGDDNFAKDPPNATLAVVTADSAEDVVLELQNPRFEGDDLLYDVNVIMGDTSVRGDGASLFIDVVGMPLTPLSVAGVARRTSRRTVRRVDRRR